MREPLPGSSDLVRTELQIWLGLRNDLAMAPNEGGLPGELGHEPDEEYLAMRERVGWQSVTLLAGLIVVLFAALWLLVALTAGRH